MKRPGPKLSLILITVIFTLVMGTVLFLALRPKSPSWYDDYDTAQEAALKEGKDILLFFDGSSWDTSSSRLKETVFSKSSFLKAVQDRVIPTALDIPIADGETTFTEQQRRNLEVADLLAIPKVPEILLMTSGNYIYASLPWDPETTGYDAFMADLEQALASGDTFKELMEKLFKAEGPEKVRIIDELVAVSPGDYIFQFYKLINSVPELDPLNETGLTGRYKLLIAYTRSVECWFNDDSEGAAAIYAELAEDPLLTAEEKQEAYYKAATMCYYGNLNDLMKMYLQMAVDAAPYTQNAAILQATLHDYIQEEQAYLNAAQ